MVEPLRGGRAGLRPATRPARRLATHPGRAGRGLGHALVLLGVAVLALVGAGATPIPARPEGGLAPPRPARARPLTAPPAAPGTYHTIRETTLWSSSGADAVAFGTLARWSLVEVRSAQGDRLLAIVPDAEGAQQSGSAWVDAVDLEPGPLAGRWAQSEVPTGLWSGPDDGAQLFTVVGEGAPFRLLGPVRAARLYVYYPGDGGPRRPGEAWVARAALAPGDPPDATPVALAGPSAVAATVPAPAPTVPPPRRTGSASPPEVSAEFIAVVDGASGELLYGKNPHGRVAPASVTKIVTAIVALERASLTDRVDVRVDSRTMADSTVMGLEPGENLSLTTLLYGLMLPSGNDAALAIATHVGGSVEHFVELMNEKVRALGLQDTHFTNPHGLDEPEHYSSPYDVVMLARYGMNDPNFATLAAAKEWSGEGYTLRNLNRLLWSYPGADGVKVGYTDAAGKTIVATASRGGKRVYVALMRSTDLVYDCTLLFDWAFANFTWD